MNLFPLINANQFIWRWQLNVQLHCCNNSFCSYHTRISQEYVPMSQILIQFTIRHYFRKSYTNLPISFLRCPIGEILFPNSMYRNYGNIMNMCYMSNHFGEVISMPSQESMSLGSNSGPGRRRPYRGNPDNRTCPVTRGDGSLTTTGSKGQ